MQHPCNPPQKPRTMATVSPLHQVVPQPNLSPYEGNSLAFNSSRTSSFAAALRKLAKQAVDPISGEKDLTQISPVSSPALSQRSITPKRSAPNPVPPQPMFLSSHQSAYPSSSPPVVTIAPSRPHATHGADARKVQVMDLNSLQQGNSASTINNGHVSEPLSLKLDSNKSVPRSNPTEKWEEHSINNKGLSSSTGSSQSRPHATIAPLPRPDDSLTSSRGFQPYRGADDIRATLPHHISHFDHHSATAAYPYTPAFLPPPPHITHPAYRFDDPLYLDRYSLLRSSVMPFPTQPGMMAPPAAFYPNSRYAADLFAQSISLGTASSNILHHERLKQEEERRNREKELELDHNRKRELELERLREKEHKEKEHKEKERKEKEQKEKERKEKNYREKEDRTESKKHTSSHSKRLDNSIIRNGTVIHSTAIQQAPPPPSLPPPPPPVTSSSVPLNLVVHPNPDQQKKESELWLPWQQPAQPHNKESTTEEICCRSTNAAQQEAQQESHPKDSALTENSHANFNSQFFVDRQQQQNIINSGANETEPKKPIQNSKKFDSIHNHILELSKKERTVHEWKHEKLQKACANSHKTKSNSEAKKAKEERHQNNGFYSHQRKQVNGLVKTVPYQDEGMHTRLLETEKSRIEFNGHIFNKGHMHNQLYDKFSVPNLQSNNLPNDTKDLRKQYTEYHISSVLKPSFESIPVISKLDKEAADLKKKGVIDDEDTENIHLHNFLIITKGPPLPLDFNPKKMKFLKLLGLTSHLKRKKIELEMYLKRRKILKDEMDIEIDNSKEAKTEPKPLNEVDPNLEHLAAKLHAKADAEKVQFMLTLGLTPLSLTQKEENARLRKIIQEERNQRNLRMQIKRNKKLAPPQLKSYGSENVADTKIGKNATEECTKTEGAKVDISYLLSSQHTTVHNEQVPYISSEAQELNSSQVFSSSTKPHLLLSSATSSNILHNKKMPNKYSFKRGHSLRREWKPITLLPAEQHCESYSEKNLTIPQDTKCDTYVSTGTQVDTSLVNMQADAKYLNTAKGSFHWPGLDAIMEAYYRHNKEQLLEKEVLTERCHQLQSHQTLLKAEVDRLSKSMSELLNLKRDLDEQRQHYQNVIDNFKAFIEAAR